MARADPALVAGIAARDGSCAEEPPVRNKKAAATPASVTAASAGALSPPRPRHRDAAWPLSGRWRGLTPRSSPESRHETAHVLRSRPSGTRRLQLRLRALPQPAPVL